jgi:hypothetical protein
MSEKKFIFIGMLPVGQDTILVDGQDPFTILVNDAIAWMDAERERAAAEKARQATIADANDIED